MEHYTAPDIEAWKEAGLDFHIENQVAFLILNRPHIKNAVTHPLRNAILKALDEVNINPDIRAAVIHGAGGAFCSGADLSEADHNEIPVPYRRGERHHMAREDGLMFGWFRVIEKMIQNLKPIVTAVDGAAYGFGCNFALAGDIIVAGETARFCEVFVQRGLPLEASGAYLLTRSVSPAIAKEIALFGEPVSAPQALAWGLVNRVVPADQVLVEATKLAEKLANGPTIMIGQIKAQINDALDQNLRQTWKDEVTYLGLGPGSDGAEAMLAFKEKRAPKFTGR
ncbi:MAG: enoyl-CoA hydratase-related protein [Candidatus Nanopelagicales bacterium]